MNLHEFFDFTFVLESYEFLIILILLKKSLFLAVYLVLTLLRILFEANFLPNTKSGNGIERTSEATCYHALTKNCIKAICGKILQRYTYTQSQTHLI